MKSKRRRRYEECKEKLHRAELSLARAYAKKEEERYWKALAKYSASLKELSCHAAKGDEKFLYDTRVRFETYRSRVPFVR